MSEWNDQRDHGWEIVHKGWGEDRALRRINRNIIRVGRIMQRIERNTENMATSEQVAAVQEAAARVEAALTVEEGQIREVIRLLQEAAAGSPDPVLDAAVATLNTVADRIAGIIPDAPPSE